jgi:hypothetical protein
MVCGLTGWGGGPGSGKQEVPHTPVHQHTHAPSLLSGEALATPAKE